MISTERDKTMPCRSPGPATVRFLVTKPITADAQGEKIPEATALNRGSPNRRGPGDITTQMPLHTLCRKPEPYGFAATGTNEQLFMVTPHTPQNKLFGIRNHHELR